MADARHRASRFGPGHLDRYSGRRSSARSGVVGEQPPP